MASEHDSLKVRGTGHVADRVLGVRVQEGVLYSQQLDPCLGDHQHQEYYLLTARHL